jgi:hypothetical protein
MLIESGFDMFALDNSIESLAWQCNSSKNKVIFRMDIAYRKQFMQMNTVISLTLLRMLLYREPDLWNTPSFKLELKF